MKRAIDIAIQVASALTAAHSVGIVHRDIKPANVMVRADDLVKVLDFGIAKFTATGENQPAETALETLPGAVVGTAAYMSPEQARGLSIDERTDVWSLGVVLYEMVTGKRPFHGDTALDVMSAVIHNRPKSLSANSLEVPARLQDIVDKALEKDRASRYQTAQELLVDLKDLKKQLESSGEGESRAVSGVEPDDNEIGEARTVALPAAPIRDVNARATLKADDLKSLRIISGRNVIVASLLLAVVLSVAAFAYWSYYGSSFQAKSIAVLPFKNESGNSELDYLSDGITDSLINSLSQLPQVTVKARNSVFRYKDADADPQQVGSELSVEAILNGRVVQRGDDLTLYLSLVDASNGNQVWGEQYDRKLSDLILLQRDIARDVSEKLRVKLSGADERRVTKDYTANPEAYRLYLRGKFHVHKLTPPEVQQGITQFQKAIELDPSYALAYVGLSGA
ncbi:MAG: serine/threonine-protein kinase, partial [Acidobacteria bacterium]|nr:serine/threonine-protein kinase [Acidobacteriota bacterium]